MPSESSAAAPRGRRWRRLIASLSFALVVMATSMVGVVAWLVYQPTTADALISRSFARLEARDPSHVGTYRQVYREFASLTRFNDLHYAVHEIAGQAAWLTGHADAALVQWNRASYHRPRQGGSPTSLVSRLIERVRAAIEVAG